MKNTLLFALGLAALAASLAPASAQTYKWKDEKGQTVIRDTPPPRAAKAQKAGGEPGAATASEDAATATPEKAVSPITPKNAAEKDMDFKKRQQDLKEKSDKAAKEQEAIAERKRNCEGARQNINTLQSPLRVTTVNSKGEPVPMDDSTRQAQLERARKIAEEACK